jgi:hypothetical protein
MNGKVVSYRGFQITPFLHEDDSGTWRVSVRVARFAASQPFAPGNIRSEFHNLEETFETEEIAREEGIAFGKKIIDGGI